MSKDRIEQKLHDIFVSKYMQRFADKLGAFDIDGMKEVYAEFEDEAKKVEELEKNAKAFTKQEEHNVPEYNRYDHSNAVSTKCGISKDKIYSMKTDIRKAAIREMVRRVIQENDENENAVAEIFCPIFENLQRYEECPLNCSDVYYDDETNSVRVIVSDPNFAKTVAEISLVKLYFGEVGFSDVQILSGNYEKTVVLKF